MNDNKLDFKKEIATFLKYEPVKIPRANKDQFLKAVGDHFIKNETCMDWSCVSTPFIKHYRIKRTFN